MPASRLRTASSVAFKPPIAVPISTPTSSGPTSSIRSRESSKASLAAATAKWLKRSIRRASLKFMYSTGSKPFTSPPILVGWLLTSICAIRSIPERPSIRPAQVSSTFKAKGVTAPIPVITTRFRTLRLFSSSSSSPSSKAVCPGVSPSMASSSLCSAILTRTGSSRSLSLRGVIYYSLSLDVNDLIDLCPGGSR